MNIMKFLSHSYDTDFITNVIAVKTWAWKFFQNLLLRRRLLSFVYLVMSREYEWYNLRSLLVMYNSKVSIP